MEGTMTDVLALPSSCPFPSLTVLLVLTILMVSVSSSL